MNNLKTKIKYIALDIDGTLLNTDEKIMEKTRESLINLEEKGYRLLLVSGRAAYSLQTFLKPLKMDEFGGYLIGVNGGMIYDLNSKKLLFERLIPADLVKEYFEAWPIRYARAAYYGDELRTDTYYNPDFKKLYTVNFMKIKEVHSLNELQERGSNKLMISSPHEKLLETVPQIREQFKDKLYMTFSAPYYFEAMMPDINKGFGLRKFSELTGTPLDQIIAFGDGDNDAPFVKAAGFGVAMGNASELTKASADDITASNDEDGIYRYLKKIELI